MVGFFSFQVRWLWTIALLAPPAVLQSSDMGSLSCCRRNHSPLWFKSKHISIERSSWILSPPCLIVCLIPGSITVHLLTCTLLLLPQNAKLHSSVILTIFFVVIIIIATCSNWKHCGLVSPPGKCFREASWFRIGVLCSFFSKYCICDEAAIASTNKAWCIDLPMVWSLLFCLIVLP